MLQSIIISPPFTLSPVLDIPVKRVESWPCVRTNVLFLCIVIIFLGHVDAVHTEANRYIFTREPQQRRQLQVRMLLMLVLMGVTDNDGNVANDGDVDRNA